MDIKTFQDWYKEAEQGNQKWRDNAVENWKFYAGTQWDESTIQALKKEKRPYLTINKILPIINFLSGYQIQNSYEIGITPKKNTTQNEALILSEIIKSITDVSGLQSQISKFFLDGVITGRGFLTGRVSYDYDVIRGDLIIERISPLNVLYDPASEKNDLSDCEYVIKTVWMSADEIKALFPDKASDIDNIHLHTQEIKFRGAERSKYDDNTSVSVLQQSKLLVKEIWYLTPTTKYFIVSSGLIYTAYTQEDITAIIQQNQLLNYQVISRPSRQLNLATVLGDLTLQDIQKPLGDFNQFPFVSFFPMKIENIDEIDIRDLSIIDNLKDIQREINKRRSQQLHIVNTFAHSGWLNKKNEGADPRKLQEFGSTPGIVIEYQNIPPAQITPPPPPQSVMLSEKEATQDLKEISAVNPDLLGYQGQRGEPGIVLQLRQRQGLIVQEKLFQELENSVIRLGNMLIDLIVKSKTFSKEEVLQIINDPTPEKIQAIDSLFASPDLKKFSVVVSIQPEAPTVKMLNFYKLTELMKMGVPIPLQILVEVSDIPYKDKILQAIQPPQQQVSPEALQGLLGQIQGQTGIAPNIPESGIPVPSEQGEPIGG